MTLVCAFTVPVRPEPKRRPRFGQGRTYTDARTKAYEAAVAIHARQAMKGRPPVTGPVSFWCSLEQTDARVCDIDNAVKALLDATQAAGVIANDRQVVHLEAHRVVHAPADRVMVRVEAVA